MNRLISPEEYRELFDSALPRTVDADTIYPNLHTLFTPNGHRLALQPDITVVRGTRGVGKTVWFKVLQDPLLREVAAEAYELPQLMRIESTAGFGAELAPDRYPGPAILADLLQHANDPSQIWSAVLASALGISDVANRAWRERLAWVRQNPESLEHALARADRLAADQGVIRLVLFDALEHLHLDRSKTDALVGGVLRLALDLRARTRHIRAKVFIRHDMLSSSRLHFPDSSKLIANAADLTWTETNLYGLLFHLLGNVDTELARKFRESNPAWRMERKSIDDIASRYTAPAKLVGDARTQHALFKDIAGPYMGAGHRKGHTYTWLPNHLMDGINQVSPRSFLRALTAAVEVTRSRYASHRYALHYEGIRRGVQDASRIRVAEITEDLPWITAAVEKLAGMQVPIDVQMIIDRWSECSLRSELSAQVTRMRQDESRVRTGPKDPDNYGELVEELVQLGVMTRRANGRIDLPDVYRIAFGVGRRGGIPRIKNAP